MDQKIKVAIDRLNSNLPLFLRQQALPEKWQSLHRAILDSLANNNRVPEYAEMEKIIGVGYLDQAIQRLASDDLVVLDAAGKQIVGAYPMTVEDTPHHLRINGNPINAMCALDAVSVAPMFGADVEIDSWCHVTHENIHIHQNGAQVVEVHPSRDVHVGVRWQNPGSCAAHSMCLEMVFLKDRETALKWQEQAPDDISIFSLDEAIEFGTGFFMPLV